MLHTAACSRSSATPRSSSAGAGLVRGRLPALLGSLALAISRGASTCSTAPTTARNDNLTKGLARHAAKNAWRLPLAIARLNGSHRTSKRFYADHDLVLTPTLSLVTPEIGWLDPPSPTRR